MLPRRIGSLVPGLVDGSRCDVAGPDLHVMSVRDIDMRIGIRMILTTTTLDEDVS